MEVWSEVQVASAAVSAASVSGHILLPAGSGGMQAATLFMESEGYGNHVPIDKHPAFNCPEFKHFARQQGLCAMDEPVGSECSHCTYITRVTVWCGGAWGWYNRVQKLEGGLASVMHTAYVASGKTARR